MAFNPKWIEGKTIAKVEMNPFRACPDMPDDKRIVHDPCITFTDGSEIVFLTEETELDTYGIAIIYRKPTR